MSANFFVANSDKNDNKTKIQYQYPKTDVNNVKMNFFGPDYLCYISGDYTVPGALTISKPNLSPVLQARGNRFGKKNNATKNTYNAVQLFIAGKVHNIPDVKYQGELIIKNVPKNEINSPALPSAVYVCFLLKNKITASGDIDAMANVTSTTQEKFNLNQLLTDSSEKAKSQSSLSSTSHPSVDARENETINYMSKDSAGNPVQVMIYTCPIDVCQGTDFSNFTTQLEFFGGFDTKREFAIITSDPLQDQSINEGFVVNRLVEGFSDEPNSQNDDGSSWMECDYGEIDSDTVPVYSMPLNSGYIADAGKWSILSGMLSLSGSFLMLLFLFFLAPYLYQKVTIDNLKSWNENETYTDAIAIKRLAFSDLLAVVVAIFNFLYFFGMGVSTKDVYLTSMGMIIFLVFVACYVIIQVKKSTKDFFKISETENLVYGSGFNFFNEAFDRNTFNAWFSAYKKLVTEKSVMGYNFGVLVAEILFMTVFYKPAKPMLIGFVVMIILNTIVTIVPGLLTIVRSISRKEPSGVAA